MTDLAGHTFDKAFTIGVTNVNEAPTDIYCPNATVAENSANGTVGRRALGDRSGCGRQRDLYADRQCRRKVPISGGNLVVTGPLDFEARPRTRSRCSATDAGGLTFEQDLHDRASPTSTRRRPRSLLSSASVAENSANGTVVGALVGDRSRCGRQRDLHADRQRRWTCSPSAAAIWL